MIWMYLGFMVTYGLVIFGWSIIDPDSFKDAWVILFIIPGLGLCVFGEMLQGVNGDDPKTKRAIKEGLLSRWHVIAVGCVAAVLCVCAIRVTREIIDKMDSSWFTLAMLVLAPGIELLLFPYFGFRYVSSVARRRMTEAYRNETKKQDMLEKSCDNVIE